MPLLASANSSKSSTRHGRWLSLVRACDAATRMMSSCQHATPPAAPFPPLCTSQGWWHSGTSPRRPSPPSQRCSRQAHPAGKESTLRLTCACHHSTACDACLHTALACTTASSRCSGASWSSSASRSGSTSRAALFSRSLSFLHLGARTFAAGAAKTAQRRCQMLACTHLQSQTRAGTPRAAQTGRPGQAGRMRRACSCDAACGAHGKQMGRRGQELHKSWTWARTAAG